MRIRSFVVDFDADAWLAQGEETVVAVKPSSSSLLELLELEIGVSLDRLREEDDDGGGGGGKANDDMLCGDVMR
jgi:hypothetical protein